MDFDGYCNAAVEREIAEGLARHDREAQEEQREAMSDFAQWCFDGGCDVAVRLDRPVVVVILCRNHRAAMGEYEFYSGAARRA